MASGGLFCHHATVYHAVAKNHCGTRIKFVTHDSLTVMRRRLDAVDKDMLSVLWLPGPASAEKVHADDPGLGCSTPTWETWSRVWSASNSTNSKHVPRSRQYPCNGNHVRETCVLNIAHSSNLFDGGQSGGRRVITKKPKTLVYAVKPGVLPPKYQDMHIDSKD